MRGIAMADRCQILGRHHVDHHVPGRTYPDRAGTNHVRKEHRQKTVNALVLISDACEEIPADLYSGARELGVPAFMFQEGDDDSTAGIYAEIANVTGGASCRFDSGSAQRLADLLKAVAAFAAGGVKALASQQTEAARLLLTQIKK
jgi:hypothetical protein